MRIDRFIIESSALVHGHWLASGNGLDLIACVFSNPGCEPQGFIRVGFEDGTKQWWQLPAKPIPRMLEEVHDLVRTLKRNRDLLGSQSQVYYLQETDVAGLHTWLRGLEKKGLVKVWKDSIQKED